MTIMLLVTTPALMIMNKSETQRDANTARWL